MRKMAKEEESKLEADFSTIIYLKMHVNLGWISTMLKSMQCKQEYDP